ncbi:SDR family NAD(P)-dependent oxidoreductase [Corynebacterium epidermidicanis]|uniref:Short chain dehydrogenase n=1 Tax=Corynebacterium epidermidicanis TaxID=1050174 RepID=A0A0G3GRI2_9CORY|nr:SDR family NAD(P)-dependent oxidoreductase [Corynebacterium epidermidicanis]AKK03165.1 short chain dehydrogenase [Corynebacterium epidermidicanis]
MTLDPQDLATCLRVLDEAGTLDPQSADSVTLQRAVAKLFKEVKRQRRQSAKQARRAADEAVLSATATANPARIDDETAGILVRPAGAAPVSLEKGAVATPHGWAGKLYRAQNCYVCKRPYTLVDSFHHQLCPECAADNRVRRNARVDLTGRRAVLTGGRAKIGMYIALKLLRDGADLTITTRFPRDAARRFAAVGDSADWLSRLHIVGIDLRDPAAVATFADEVAAAGPLDILINNAAQTVRRSPGSYSGLIDGEQAPLTGVENKVDLRAIGATSDLHPAALVSGSSPSAADALVSQAMLGGSASLARIADGTAVDAGGLIPDLVSHNSWVATVGEVDPVELLEVQLCNQTAPFILVNRLRPALEAAPARRKYVVNVSAMEGVFGRGYKGPGHPHTNMSKAALNMLTRTAAGELFEHGILMTAVDTGWITDERPHTAKARLAEEGFHAPLDLVDGAARVYDPIVQGENGVDLYGCFLKDYRPHAW